jgi:hypothetical protein
MLAALGRDDVARAVVGHAGQVAVAPGPGHLVDADRREVLEPLLIELVLHDPLHDPPHRPPESIRSSAAIGAVASC